MVTEYLRNVYRRGTADARIGFDLLALVMGDLLSSTALTGLQEGKTRLDVDRDAIQGLINARGEEFTAALRAKLNALNVRSLGTPTVDPRTRVVTVPYVDGGGTARSVTYTLPEASTDRLTPRAALTAADSTAAGVIENLGGVAWVNREGADAHKARFVAEVDPRDATVFGFWDFAPRSADQYGSQLSGAGSPRMRVKTSGTFAGGSDVAQVRISQAVMTSARADAGAGQPAQVVHWHDDTSGAYALQELYRRPALDITSQWWGYGNTDVRVAEIADSHEITLDFETVAGSGAVGVPVRAADAWSLLIEPVRFDATMAGAGTTSDPRRVATPLRLVDDAAAYATIVSGNSDGKRDGVYFYPEASG